MQGAVMSAGAGSRFMEIPGHRTYIGSFTGVCPREHCGGSVMAEFYTSGIEIKCMHCCRDVAVDSVTKLEIRNYIRKQMKIDE